MTVTKKRHPAAFKARVALEAAKQTRTLTELSGTFQVHSVPISKWKKQLLDSIESLFRDGRRPTDHDESQAIQAELYEQIGRLKMEVEWLKKNNDLTVSYYPGSKEGHIPTRRASEGSGAFPSLARRVNMQQHAELPCRGNSSTVSGRDQGSSHLSYCAYET